LKNNWTVILLIILLGYKLGAQDIHFSQFNENPTLINPALTGVSNSIRASITNRNQWASVSKPYKTFGASFEKQFNSAAWQEHKSKSMMSAGLSLYKDRAGDGNLGQTHVNLSLSNFIVLNKTNIISVGLQGSLVQRMIEQDNLLFPNQYNGSVYDSQQSSNEKFENFKFTYFDLGAGSQWTYSREQKNLEAHKQFTSHFGFAVYHLAEPRHEFLGTLSKLHVKYVTHGDLIASLGKSNMALSPSFLLQFQGPSREIVIGAMLRHYIKIDSKYTGLILRDCFGYGFYLRNKDAILLSALFERKEKLGIVISYDVNISRLSAASAYRGGFELTLRYTAPRFNFYQRQ